MIWVPCTSITMEATGRGFSRAQNAEMGNQSASTLGDRSPCLSDDAFILVVRGDGLVRILEANGNEWIEVGEEATDSGVYNYVAISRESTSMDGASVLDVSCPQETTPDATSASPVLAPPPVEAPMKTPIAVPALSPSPTGSPTGNTKATI